MLLTYNLIDIMAQPTKCRSCTQGNYGCTCIGYQHLYQMHHDIRETIQTRIERQRVRLAGDYR